MSNMSDWDVDEYTNWWPGWWPLVAVLIVFLLACGGVRCEMGINVDSKPSDQAQQAEQP